MAVIPAVVRRRKDTSVNTAHERVTLSELTDAKEIVTALGAGVEDKLDIFLRESLQRQIVA